MPELLIGLTLGLLVIAAAIMVYGTSKQSWLHMAAADALHANARVAMRNLQDRAQSAGGAYLSTAPDNTTRITMTDEATHPAVTGVNGNKANESLTLSHWRALDPMDCQGNTSSTQAQIRDDYKLNTNKELTCKDLDLPGSTYQAIAEGVEDFQVRYAQANPNNHTLQWVTADQVSSMARVVAVEVCLRLASPSMVNTPQQIHTNQRGCTNEALLSDGRLRRVFKRVMTVRNRTDVMP